MLDTGKKIVQDLFNLLESHGVTQVVCSPGSRNMPLLMAADAREKLNKIVVIDERTAGFVALGIAQQSNAPVALVCTSGTALLNYSPAIAEAYYQGYPLIVISADRPKEWIDQDDSQTLRQFDALANFVKKSYDVDDTIHCSDSLWYANRIFNDALINATRPKQGPVHINIRLSVPLDITDTTVTPNHFATRTILRYNSPAVYSRTELQNFAKQLIGKKVMVIAGFMKPDAKVNEQLKKFARHDNVVVMAETISNLHLPDEAYVIDPALSTLKDWDESALDTMIPDIVITMGGALVSRMLKEFLRKAAASNKNLEHWSFGEQDYVVDCFKALTLKIEDYPAPLIGQISAEMAHQIKINNARPDNDPDKFAYTDNIKAFKNNWDIIRKAASHRLLSLAENAPWSEMKALHYIFSNIPAGCNIQLSNGTPVRYNQILTRRIPHTVFCNRGVSGIEGSTSTAVGFASSSSHPCLLITGDMSAAHDLGGLLTAANLKSHIKIVIIQNAGGGIFRFVKSTRSWDKREDYLCADPKADFAKLADAFGFGYNVADSYDSLIKQFKILIEQTGRSILEIKVPPTLSAEILKEALRQ